MRQNLGPCGQVMSPEDQILRFQGNLQHKSASQTGPYGFTGCVYLSLSVSHCPCTHFKDESFTT